ncbi:MAG TPA: hypothetical protein VMN60_06925 [Longimicrobiales bacterium]|nr:hypothetical protein [Longimicrobiales bacterium]
MKAAVIELQSGRWLKQITTTLNAAVLELVHVANSENRMRVQLPDHWRTFDDQQLQECARRSEVRLWSDEDGILWRVSTVGPGTAFPFPLQERHLVFDSERAWAGIVRFGNECELGDLTDLDLRSMRDRVSDFGGRRRAYRGPTLIR